MNLVPNEESEVARASSLAQRFRPEAIGDFTSCVNVGRRAKRESHPFEANWHELLASARRPSAILCHCDVCKLADDILHIAAGRITSGLPDKIGKRNLVSLKD
jgi:hypothetical protein